MERPTRPESLPERADNAENGVKCPICGDMVLIGSEGQAQGDGTVTCPVCHQTQKISKSRVIGVSNEEY